MLEYRGFYTAWKWVWIGIFVELGISLLLVVLQAAALTWLARECRRPQTSCCEGLAVLCREGPSVL